MTRPAYCFAPAARMIFYIRRCARREILGFGLRSGDKLVTMLKAKEPGHISFRGILISTKTRDAPSRAKRVTRLSDRIVSSVWRACSVQVDCLKNFGCLVALRCARHLSDEQP